jgi:hypothetical protein
MKPIHLLLIGLAAWGPSGLAAQSATQTAQGVVYHDQNANGRRDAREPGIADVKVTNGTDFVRTDAQGRYRIPVGDDAIISVVKPGNFRYPVDSLNLVRFFHIHKPAGSPQLRYAGVAPTGALPASVDFPLLTGEASETFSVIAFADPQPYSLQEVGYFDASIVQELVGVRGPAFGISLGDLVGDQLDLFEPLNRATARIGLPWFNVYGNHDMNFDAKEDRLADETFERVYGPANYAFYHGKVLFITLDNVVYPNPYTSSSYIGGYRDDQFRFLENLLPLVPEDHLVVISGHIPIFDEFPFGETFLDAHRRRLFDILKDHPHTVSLSGHTHTQRHHFFTSKDGWKRDVPHHHFNVATASGDWWSGRKDDAGVPDATMRDGTPKGYAILHFTGNTYRFEYKAYGKPASYQMSLHAPKVIPRTEGTRRSTRAQLVANVFNGSERCVVEYRIDDGAWQRMRFMPGEDPGRAAMRYEADTADTPQPFVRPSNPALSYHIWRANLPTGLPLGTRTIRVRVTTQFGDVHEDALSIDVVESTME